MTLDLEDPRIRASIRVVGDRAKLTIEYPREIVYRDRVFDALCDLMRPRDYPTPESAASEQRAR